jgi:hypothetical protein
LILVVVAAAIALVISGSLSGDDSAEQQDKQRTSGTICPNGDPDLIKNGYYVVEEGDNFTSIAAKTCVPEDELQQLNPNLDPFGLQVQNCVDLVPDGCRRLAGG